MLPQRPLIQPDIRTEIHLQQPVWWGPPAALLISILCVISLGVSLRKLKESLPVAGKDLVSKEQVGRIEQILAQLALITDADRVTLGMFHNGKIGTRGNHYEKMCVLASYNAPGIRPLPELNSDIKAETLLTPLFDRGGELKLLREEVPEDCLLYQKRRDIQAIWNKILRSGNVETAIISFHWCHSVLPLPIPTEGTWGDRLMTELVSELEKIMRA